MQLNEKTKTKPKTQKCRWRRNANTISWSIKYGGVWRWKRWWWWWWQWQRSKAIIVLWWFCFNFILLFFTYIHSLCILNCIRFSICLRRYDSTIDTINKEKSCMQFTWPNGRIYNMHNAQTQFVTKYNYYYLHRHVHFICVILLFIHSMLFAFASIVFFYFILVERLYQKKLRNEIAILQNMAQSVRLL